MELPLIKEIVIPNPPTKWTLNYKKDKFDKDGKLITHQDWYLTANLFYSDKTSYHITSKIIKETKQFLYPFLKGLPELEKMELDIIYYSMKHIDLDNKAYFFRKLILDILKTPSPRQILNANKRGNEIITTNTIKDDDTKCITRMSEQFFIGEHRMVLRIFGRVKDNQKSLDLFFI